MRGNPERERLAMIRSHLPCRGGMCSVIDCSQSITQSLPNPNSVSMFFWGFDLEFFLFVVCLFCFIFCLCSGDLVSLLQDATKELIRVVMVVLCTTEP